MTAAAASIAAIGMTARAARREILGSCLVEPASPRRRTAAIPQPINVTTSRATAQLESTRIPAAAMRIRVRTRVARPHPTTTIARSARSPDARGRSAAATAYPGASSARRRPGTSAAAGEPVAAAMIAPSPATRATAARSRLRRATEDLHVVDDDVAAVVHPVDAREGFELAD